MAYKLSHMMEIRAEALQPKLQELLAGWEKNTLDHGVLLTTGICGAEAVALIERYNHAAGPPVTLIDGRILSDLFLQYFGDSLQTRGISGE